MTIKSTILGTLLASTMLAAGLTTASHADTAEASQPARRGSHTVNDPTADVRYQPGTKLAPRKATDITSATYSTDADTFYYRFRLVDYVSGFSTPAGTMFYEISFKIGSTTVRSLHLVRHGRDDAKPLITAGSRTLRCSSAKVNHDYAGNTFYVSIPKRCLPDGNTLRKLRGRASYDNEDTGKWAVDRVAKTKLRLR